MDILKGLTNRLESVGETQDPDEAKSLKAWLDSGGLESLKPTLVAYVDKIATQTVKPLELSVRRFDEWKEHTFSVFPYNTLIEFQEVIGKTLGLKPNKFDLRFSYRDPDSGDTVLLKEKKTIGEIVGSRASLVKVTIKPSLKAKWFEEKDIIHMPIQIFKGDEDEEPDQLIVVEITRRTTLSLLAQTISQQTDKVVHDDDTIIFINEDGLGNPATFRENLLAWNMWYRYDLGIVSVFL